MNMKKRKWLSLFLSVAMVMTVFPTNALAEGGKTAAEEPCIHHIIHTEDCGWAAAQAEIPCDKDCSDTDGDGVIDHAEDCAYTTATEGSPCSYECNICPVQILIDALPEADSITADNATDVSAKIDEIDEAKLSLADEESVLLDYTRYDTVISKIMELEGQTEANVLVEAGDTGGFTVTGGTLGTDYSYSDGILTVKSSTALTISTTGTLNECIQIAGGVIANLNFNGVSIYCKDTVYGRRIDAVVLETGATLNLNLQGDNFLKSYYRHGIKINDNSNLIISGNGSLEAIGDNGGGRDGINMGTGASLTLNSGTLRAIGGHDNYSKTQYSIGAGIAGGSVTINGGYVYAEGALHWYDWTQITKPGISSAFSSNGDVFINSVRGIEDKSNQSAWKGLIFDDNDGRVYSDYILSLDFSVKEGQKLTVPENTTLTIANGVTLTNKGTIINNGTINNQGTINNSGTIIGSGTITGNPVKEIVKYINSQNAEQSAVCDAAITADNINSYGTLNSGWYVVKGAVTASSRINVSGDVHLILADGCNFTVNGGIGVNIGKNLTVYGQSAQTGALIATATGMDAGIRVPEGASLTINGGCITAVGSEDKSRYGAGAGIGANGYRGDGEDSGAITINGGMVQATGGSTNFGGAAGIGGSGSSKNAAYIEITGGHIIANGGENGAAGIGGGGHDGELKSYTITGGYIEATGHRATTNNSKVNANAIGGGTGKSKADLTGTNAIVIDHTAKTATFYGTTLNQNMTIPKDYTMTIEQGQTLNIPTGVTLTNNGKLYVDGTLNGTVSDNVYYPLTVNGGTAGGEVSTYLDKNYGKAGANINLTAANVPVGQAVGGWTTSESTVTVRNNKFTMPAKTLTVSAQYINAPTYTVTIPAP